jgi:ribosomal protein S18 acetylase RimI-like enzyme
VHGLPPAPRRRPYTAEDNRAAKEDRVRAGTAHAALVYDGDDCVGWCQFGPPAELPRIKHKRSYDRLSRQPPDWRITCFFVAKTHRQAGVASAALEGALREIARLGGGTVQSSPEDVTDRSVSSSFLYNSTVSLFERHGFERTHRLGKNHWLVTKVVEGVVPAMTRMSRVPWNFGGGQMSSGDVHEVILHDGSDSFGDLAFERGA